jgi:hypothetical protein
MHDRDDDIDRAITRLLIRLGPGRLGPALCWAVMRPDAELEAWGLELSPDDRLALAAWTLELARREP